MAARRARAAAVAMEVVEDATPPAAGAVLLAGVQSRHAIFRDELVRRAFYAAEAAHRGQVFDRIPPSLPLAL